jgi:hypothetical protein
MKSEYHWLLPNIIGLVFDQLFVLENIELKLQTRKLVNVFGRKKTE